MAALEVPNPLRDPLGAALVPGVAALEVEVVGVDVGRVPPGGGIADVAKETSAEGAHDGAGDLLLNREDVLDLAIVGLGPEAPAVGGVGELHGDPEPLPHPADRTLEDDGHLQPFADLPHVERLAFEGEHRGARGHAESLHLHQGVDQLVGNPVAEVLVVGISAGIHEGQHRDGPRLSGRAGDQAGATAVQRPGEVGRGGEPLSRVLGEGPGQRLLDRHRHGGAKGADRGGRLHHVLGHHRPGARAGKGGLPSQHLEQDAAQAVEVAAAVQVSVRAGLLRAHVLRGTDGDPGVGPPIGTRRPNGARDSEVGYHRLTLVQQDVLRLDVPVHHLVPVGVVEGRGHGARDSDRLVDG